MRFLFPIASSKIHSAQIQKPKTIKHSNTIHSVRYNHSFVGYYLHILKLFCTTLIYRCGRSHVFRIIPVGWLPPSHPYLLPLLHVFLAIIAAVWQRRINLFFQFKPKLFGSTNFYGCRPNSFLILYSTFEEWWTTSIINMLICVKFSHSDSNRWIRSGNKICGQF